MRKCNQLNGFVKVKWFSRLSKLCSSRQPNLSTDNAAATTDLSTFHSVEAQNIIQNLFHHRQTANQAINHLSLILLDVFKDPFALKILDGQESGVERNSDFVEDYMGKDELARAWNGEKGMNVL